MKLGNLKAIFTMLAVLPLSVLAGKSVDESWDIDATASVSIENIAGKVVIVGWDRNEAHLSGELGDSVDELEVNAAGSSLQISVINRNERNVDDTDLKLMVPRAAGLDIETVSADIYISKMTNEKLTASSVSGDVEVSATSQWVSIESVSGDVEFSGQTGRISAESVSGDIGLSGISGEIAATTVSGDMELSAGALESAKLETVSGDIMVTGEISANGRLSAESMSGDVVVSLPGAQTGLFKAESFSGRITSAFGSVKHAKHGPGSHLKHSTGSGGAEVRVESFSGNITLRHD
jgi:DUF4097 and DUF4098 domain-containing protein YvlB